MYLGLPAKLRQYTDIMSKRSALTVVFEITVKNVRDFNTANLSEHLYDSWMAWWSLEVLDWFRLPGLPYSVVKSILLYSSCVSVPTVPSDIYMGGSTLRCASPCMVHVINIEAR